MPRPTRLRLTLPAVAAAGTTALVAVAALAWPDSAAGCSVMLGPYPWRSATATAVVLRATRDTVATARAWSNAEWRSATLNRVRGLPGPGTLGSIAADVWTQQPWQRRYGQVVLLERVAGSGSDTLQPLLARGQRRAVVVNWRYGSPCWPQVRVPTESARILEPDTATFLAAALRPRAQWAEGMPTFDVFEGGEPYPHWFERLARASSFGHWTDARRNRPWLTPAEYLTLYQSLPVDEPLPVTPDRFSSLFAWERTHRDLARRFPADRILRQAHETAAEHAADREP
ncbi:MAG TPA: hypothetical protein VKA84_10575 [Gemmatimonadaceae bacterium]|nr:hypothetical protein [Gemmatimonadaceae bacterium]